MANPGVLIVSASTGSGHLRAADALVDAFARNHPGVPVEHVDLLCLAPRWVRTVLGAGYEAIAARAPRLWKGIYHATDFGAQDRARWGPAAERVLFREFRRLVRSREWQACLFTHFFPCQLAAGREGFPPFSLAVTDFELHRVWVQRRVGRYFVATEAMATELRRRVPGAAVEVTGIPVSPALAAAPARSEARARLGVDPARPMALVVGGGIGIGVEESALAALRATPREVQIVAACGRNAGARARLAALGLPEARLRVHGYLSELTTWMAAADLVASKPGGLTVSEALALGRPLLLTRPIPGAEEGNARVLTAAGAALAARSAAEIDAEFARAFAEPGLLPALAGRAAALGRPDAAARIAASVLTSPARTPRRQDRVSLSLSY